MGTTWAGRLWAWIAVLLMLVAAARGDEPERPGSEGVTSSAPADFAAPQSASKPEVGTPVAGTGAKKPATPEGGAGDTATSAMAKPPAEKSAHATTTTTTTAEAEAKVVRTETHDALDRLATQAKPYSAAATATTKALPEGLEERLRFLDDWDKVKAAEARHEAEPSPERQAADMKAQLERVQALLVQSAKAPDALLPGVFRNPAGLVTDATRAEMKEALEAAKSDENDWKVKWEQLKADSTKAINTQSPLRIERDKIHQRVAGLKSRHDEREAAVVAAQTPEEAMLARERLINLSWELRVESERLIFQEALLAHESARLDLRALNLQVLDAHAHLAARTLKRVQERYRLVTEAQERKLRQDAASEEKHAASSDDPLEKYRARRAADLLELQAKVLKLENPLATSLYPVFEEQRSLADEAVNDFAGVKALIADGTVSHLDALRLNINFRRIGPERAGIVSHELARASRHLTLLENALNGVEMDLIDNSRNDRLQYEDLLQRLPKTRYEVAGRVFQELVAQHLQLLERKRSALLKLAQRAEMTHQEIERRLKTLDDEYGFIRTHIFWVRDQEPIGAVTLAQCQSEFAHLGPSLLPLLQEACDRSLWGRVSPEFVVAALALLALPWPLSRLRRSLCPCHPRTP